MFCDDVHSLAAAARARLDQHRQADPARLASEAPIGLVVAVISGESRHSDFCRQTARRGLVAERPHRRGRRSYPRDARLLDRVGEVRVLGQEAVARVDGVSPGGASGGQHGGRIEVGAQERNDFVRGTCPPRASLILGDQRQAFDPQLPARARDADDQLAAVGNQQALDGSCLDGSCLDGRETNRLFREAKRGRIDLDARAHLDGL